jgi:hypothetical protein
MIIVMEKCYLWSPAMNLDDMKAGVEKALKGAL